MAPYCNAFSLASSLFSPRYIFRRFQKIELHFHPIPHAHHTQMWPFVDRPSMKDEEQQVVIQELQDLIRQLNSGEPLSLTLLAAYAAQSLGTKRKHDACPTEGDQVSHSLEQTRQEELTLFEKYIGPYDDVLAGAFRHINYEYNDAFDGHNNRRVGTGRYSDPYKLCDDGPKPNAHVWLGLFLGRNAEDGSRELDKQYDLTTSSLSNFHRNDDQPGPGISHIYDT
jgi:hypothetical protein